MQKSTALSKPPQKRTQMACTKCRRGKKKCAPDENAPNRRCESCTKGNYECIYEPVDSGTRSSSPVEETRNIPDTAIFRGNSLQASHPSYPPALTGNISRATYAHGGGTHHGLGQSGTPYSHTSGAPHQPSESSYPHPPDYGYDMSQPSQFYSQSQQLPSYVFGGFQQSRAPQLQAYPIEPYPANPPEGRLVQNYSHPQPYYDQAPLVSSYRVCAHGQSHDCRACSSSRG